MKWFLCRLGFHDWTNTKNVQLPFRCRRCHKALKWGRA